MRFLCAGFCRAILAPLCLVAAWVAPLRAAQPPPGAPPQVKAPKEPASLSQELRQIFHRPDPVEVPAAAFLAPRSPADPEPRPLVADARAEVTLSIFRLCRRLRLEEKWDRLFQAYQRLLDQYPDVLFPVGKGLYQPAGQICRQLLTTLPPDRLEQYRRQIEPAAARLFRRAENAKGEAERRRLLAQLVDRYLFSSSGAEAGRRLGDRHFDAGEWTAATEIWLRLLQGPLRDRPADQRTHRPWLLVKLAICAQASGHPDRAQQLLDLVKRRFPKETFLLAGRPQGAASLTQAVLASFRQAGEAVDPRRRGRSKRTPWPTYGGSNQRAQASPVASVPGWLLWSEPLWPEAARPAQEKPRPRRPQARPDGPRQLPWFPAIADGIVAYSDGHRILARDLQTGRLRWQFVPPKGAPLAERVRAEGRDAPGPPRCYGLTLARGKVIAAVRSQRPSSVGGARDAFHGPDALVAIEAESRQGRVAWQRGGPNEPDERLKLLGFGPAPAVRGSVLYAAAMSLAQRDVYLCGFDVDSGKLIWKTLLFPATAVGYRRPASEILPTLVPVEWEGMVFVTSDGGAVAAVAAPTGRVEWVLNYRAALGQDTDKPRRPGLFRALLNPPMLSRGLLLLLPRDSYSLLAVEARTGQIRWTRRFDEEALLVAAGRGKVYLVSDRLWILDLITGQVKMKTPRLKERPLGRGALLGRALYLPVRTGLWMFDADTGRPLGATRPSVAWDQRVTEPGEPKGRSGNLARGEGKLVLISPESVQAMEPYPTLAELQKRIHEEPENYRHALRLARYYKWKQNDAAALEQQVRVEALLKGQPGPAAAAALHRVRADQHAIWMRRAQAEGADELTVRGAYEHALASAPDQAARLKTLLALARHLGRHGRVKPALQRYRQIADEFSDALIPIDAVQKTCARTLAVARVARLLQTHAATVDPATAEAGRRFLQQYGWAPRGEARALRPPFRQEWELEGVRQYLTDEDRIFIRRKGLIECRDLRTGDLHWQHERGWIGVELIPDRARGRRASILRVFLASPAARAGLRLGDTVVRWNNHEIKTATELASLVDACPVGQEIRLTYLRGGERRTGRVVVAPRPRKYADQTLGPLDHLVGVVGENLILARGWAVIGLNQKTGAWAFGFGLPATGLRPTRVEAQGHVAVVRSRYETKRGDAPTRAPFLLSGWSLPGGKKLFEERLVRDHRDPVASVGQWTVVANRDTARLRAFHLVDGAVAAEQALAWPGKPLELQVWSRPKWKPPWCAVRSDQHLGRWNPGEKTFAWRTEAPWGRIHHVFADTEGFYAVFNHWRLKMLDPGGRIRWSRLTECGGWVSDLQVDRGQLFLTAHRGQSGFVECYAAATGKLVWQAELGRVSKVGLTAVTPQCLAVWQKAGAEPAALWFLDRANGRRLSQMQLPGIRRHRVRVVGGRLLVATAERLTAYGGGGN